VSGAITGSSANSDLVVDAATVTLLTSNSYNGPTFIRSGGILNAAAAGALPTSPARSAMVLDDSGSGYSQLRLSAANQSILSLSGAATSAVNLSADASPHLLTIGNSLGLNATDFAGGITGSGGLIKDGTSTQILSGANTFTGTTTINGGTLQAAAANALGGTSAILINHGGLLAISASSAIHSTAVVTLNSSSDRALAFSGSLSTSFGLLALSSTSVIDLGSGSTSLHMADSSASGLTLQQLANINIYGDNGQTLLGQSSLLTSGELVIPEPRCLVLMLSGILLLVRRRRAGV
jgi:autotransporter-associated beta strand protein